MEENKPIENQEETLNNDELKGAIEETLAKIRNQSIVVGFRVCCQTILDKLNEFEKTPGSKSNNDHKRLIKNIRKFVETGLSRKINENGEVEVPEETVQN